MGTTPRRDTVSRVSRWRVIAAHRPLSVAIPRACPPPDSLVPLASSDKTDLSLGEMLQVLDVARMLRREQNLAEAELNHRERVVSLRERLLAAAEAAGDRVTAEEVEAAIEIYFKNLHKYADPPWSVSLLLAHLYIRREIVAIVLLTALALFGLRWWFAAPAVPGTHRVAPMAPAPRAELDESPPPQTPPAKPIEDHLAILRALAEGPNAVQELARLEREVRAAQEIGSTSHLDRLRTALADLEQRLRLEYEVRIVSAPGRLSGVARDFVGRLSGFYLIFEARTPDGRILPRTITSREDGTTRTVREWGEQVPEDVLQRIEADKRADGVVDESLFAVKKRGWLAEEVRLPGAGGSPLRRGGQILEW